MNPREKGRELCLARGFHDYEEFIDLARGGFSRCNDCGNEIEAEEDEDW